MKKIKGKKITAGLTSLFLITVLVITGCIGLTGLRIFRSFADDQCIQLGRVYR